MQRRRRPDHWGLRLGEEMQEAARQIAAGAGAGIEDIVVADDRPVPAVAQQILTWPGWV